MLKRYIGLAIAFLLITSCDKANKSNESEQTTQEEVVKGDSTEVYTEEDHTSTDEYMVTMAVGSDDGKQFIALNNGKGSSFFKHFTHSIYEGKTYPIRFVKMKRQHPGDNGRETTQNFYYMSGALFETTKNFIKVDEYEWVYALLCNDAFMRDFELVNVKTEEREGSSSLAEVREDLTSAERKVKNVFEEEYERRIKGISCYQSIREKGIYFYAMQFEVEMGQALGVIAIETPDGFAVLEEHRSYDEVSTWRVDDEGCYYPKYVVECFLKRSDNTLVFLLKDGGAEGINFDMWTIEGDEIVPYVLNKKAVDPNRSKANEDEEEQENRASWSFYTAPL